jgi:ubiquinol-cytochrome c reductase subunit 7
MDQAGRGEHNAARRGHAANPSQDVPYLSHIVTELEAEMAEREDLEAMIITKRNRNANAANNNH